MEGERWICVRDAICLKKPSTSARLRRPISSGLMSSTEKSFFLPALAAAAARLRRTVPDSVKSSSTPSGAVAPASASFSSVLVSF